MSYHKLKQNDHTPDYEKYILYMHLFLVKEIYSTLKKNFSVL